MDHAAAFERQMQDPEFTREWRRLRERKVRQAAVLYWLWAHTGIPCIERYILRTFTKDECFEALKRAMSFAAWWKARG